MNFRKTHIGFDTKLYTIKFFKMEEFYLEIITGV